ncbi:hypothetical protein, partial [Nostoc sp.]|uniref:hypothetical protein n=1 Tax=Nostoc sp. TaxID=1180 RepID=UPI002FFA8D38
GVILQTAGTLLQYTFWQFLTPIPSSFVRNPGIALGNLAHPDVICVGVASRRHRHRKKLILERI